MTKLQLFILLLNNIRKRSSRSILSETNTAARVFTLIGMGIACIYLIAVGVMTGLAAAGDNTFTIVCIMPFVLLIDFAMRLSMQQTPYVFLRPYLLLPVRRSDVISSYLWSSLLSPSNFIWLCLFLPYTVITVCGGTTATTAIAILFICQTLMLANCLCYLGVRTLAAINVLWWLLPVGTIAIGAAAGYVIGYENAFLTLSEYGSSPVAAIFCVAAAALLFYADIRIISRTSYMTAARKSDIRIKSLPKETLFNRYGLVGEYIKLDIKSIMRNKSLRNRFLQSLLLIVIFCAMITVTATEEIGYDDSMICLYCFAIIGISNLSNMMGPEGNYIDLLMVHKENILTMLRAKYYLFCAVLLLPVIILIPTVISGKFPPMMMPAYVFTVTGIQYPALFCLAAYNRQTLPLNSNIFSKTTSDALRPILILLFVVVLPMAAVTLLTSILGDTTAFAVLTVIGLCSTLLSPLWMRGVYRLMMARRYINIEGFRATRERI